MQRVWIFDGTGRSVSPNAFWQWLRSLEDGVAIDTETAGLGWSDAVRLVQFGDESSGFAVDVSQQEGTQLVCDALDAFTRPLVLHNAGFDFHALARLLAPHGFGVDELWARTTDTYVLAHVANPEALHGLDAQNAAVLGNDTSGYKKAFRAMMRKRKWTWATVPRLLLVPYGVADTCVTFQLYCHYRTQLSQVEWEVVRAEMDVARETWLVERHGMRLDLTYAKGLRSRWTADLEAARVMFADKYGVENPNANAQIAEALVATGWKPKTLTEKSRKPKLDKAILEGLEDKYPLVRDLLDYKRKGKWLSAYVGNCLDAVDERGYVHASYNSLGAKTGRMSCSNPPLQQLPKGGGGEIRRLFIASPGNVVASVDYSAVEFRLAGALSGDRRIIDVYESGGDWYSQVAADLRITRPQAKVFVLAILYGARGRRIAAALKIPFGKARGLVDDFWLAYATLAEWNERLTADAENGVPIVSWWGRTLRPHAPYAAGNAVIQGTAAEVMKAGLLRMRDADLLHYVCAIVHDEVVLDVPRADAEKVTAEVAVTLSDLATFACPLVAEGKVYGRSWGDGYAV